jgi:DNA-binding beta-propeller fold protein YncE
MKITIRYTIPVIIFSIFLFGCAPAKWTPVKSQETNISWPPPPAQPKVRYLSEITGFRQEGQTVSSLLFGKSEKGKIIKPVAIVTGKDGRMAIADQGRKGVHLYLPVSQEYHFIASADGNMIQSPVGVAFDDLGNLYVTESLLNKILVFDTRGDFHSAITMAGNAPLKRPTGIVFSSHDKQLYVSDTLGHQILVFYENRHFVTQLASRGESMGALNFPTHIAVDKKGSIYIVDSMNFRAQIYSPTTSKWFMFGTHGNGSGNFASPKGIDVDTNGVIYISEALFDAVQVFDNHGHYLLAVGSQGNGPGQFWMPSGLFIDPKDRMYVCDTYNQRIQVFQIITNQPENNSEDGVMPCGKKSQI